MIRLEILRESKQRHRVRYQLECCVHARASSFIKDIRYVEKEQRAPSKLVHGLKYKR